MAPANSSPRIEWVRPPRQERSHRTLERTLEAAEALIARKGFDGTSVAEICKQAGSSVGAFYARFPDKEALLRELYDRFTTQSLATIDAALDPARWDGVPLDQFLRTAIRFLLSVFTERRELISAFGRTRLRGAPLASFGERVGVVLAERCTAFAGARGEPITHPRPLEAIGFLCWIILNALESHTAHAAPVGRERDLISPEDLVDETVRMCQAHLGLLAP